VEDQADVDSRALFSFSLPPVSILRLPSLQKRVADPPLFRVGRGRGSVWGGAVFSPIFFHFPSLFKFSDPGDSLLKATEGRSSECLFSVSRTLVSSQKLRFFCAQILARFYGRYGIKSFLGVLKMPVVLFFGLD